MMSRKYVEGSHSDRNLCAGLHYGTLQVFIEEMTYTVDYSK